MKPGDFLLGVLDVFAILLPGSLATWLAAQYVPAQTLRRALSFGQDATAAAPDTLLIGIAFVVSSYILGHFVFMLGSQLDESYDRWRKRTLPRQRDVTFRAANALHTTLNPTLEYPHFSTLKWARAYIQVTAPEARVEIDRLEADQKFFRGLVVIAALAAAHFLLREHAPAAGLGAILMGVMSYQRYCDRRLKMTELTYGTAVILHAKIVAGLASSPGSKP